VIGSTYSPRRCDSRGIEHPRDLTIGKSAGELSDYFDDLALGRMTVLADSTLAHVQYRVLVALPVDSQLDTLLGNDTGDDLFDQDPNQTLFHPIVSRRVGPGFRKALGQSEQALAIGHRLSAPFILE